MTIQHKLIADADLHEPKGIAASTVNKVYVANGSGSGTWQKLSPPQLSGLTTNGTAGDTLSVDGSGNFVFSSAAHGQVDFYNVGTPYSLAYPSTFTKLAPTTTANGNASQFTEATTARLTYTGIDTAPFLINFDAAIDQSTGTNKDITLAIAKNGTVVGGYSLVTTQSGQKHSLSGSFTLSLATNDYVEVFALNSGASGAVNVYALQLNAIFAGA
jgi:hypothetical protein